MSRRTKRVLNGLAYFCMPALYLVLGYALLFAALRPVWQMGQAAVNLLVARDTPVFEPQLTSVFDPESAARTPVQTRSSDPEVPAEAPYIRIQDIEPPEDGAHYANLSCARIGLEAPVYWDDTNAILRSGAGHYIASTLPGYGGLIVLSAHNTTYFKPLKDVEVGDVFQYNTNYCDYEYEVVSVEVLDEDVLRDYILAHLLDENNEQLLLYTCYPFGPHVGRKTDRLTVLGKRISGYDVRWKEVRHEAD